MSAGQPDGGGTGLDTASLGIAIGGALALAAAMGIGRFVYTPILPAMSVAFGWSPADAGLVAAANFVGYLIGAVATGRGLAAADPRRGLVAGLIASAATTLASGATGWLPGLTMLRFTGGIASAFVLVCASTLVLTALSNAGNQSRLAAVHFGGVGAGIVASAVLVGAIAAAGGSWPAMWFGAGALAAVCCALAVRLLPPCALAHSAATERGRLGAGFGPLAASYGLVGFGYVITATFLVAIVRDTPQMRPLEFWIWIVVGLAAMPSIALWQWVAGRIGTLYAYAAACLLEAAGIAASVLWPSPAGALAAAALLGATFMGLTALGLAAARTLAPAEPQRAIGTLTAGFGAGQVAGPLFAGQLASVTGDLVAASLAAAVALLVAGALALAAQALAAQVLAAQVRSTPE